MKYLPVAAIAALLLIASTGILAGTASAAATSNHTVTSYVVDQTGASLPNVKIEITNSTLNTTVTHIGYTNSSGVFTSPPLSPGNYTVSAVDPGYLANRSYRVDLTLNNATVSFMMTMLKGNLTGYVTTGKIPIVNASVTLTDSFISFRAFSSAPLGAYSLIGIPSGKYNVTASRAGYLDFNATVVVSAGVESWLNLTMQPTLGILTGVVNSTAQNGKPGPLADANVTLQGPGGTYHTVTNSQGIYYFTNLTQGTYTVSIQEGGYSPGQGSVTVSLAKTSYLNFSLPSLTRSAPFTIPGFIGNLDLDHSLMIVALIIVMIAVTGTLTLLNKSYNWKEERKEESGGEGKEKKE